MVRFQLSCKAQVSGGTRNSPVRYFHTKHWETDMLKGGLLWLIGIPLPIILILFFMGWLN
ncbi:hypothetical protein [Microvirga sesbaniae]|uniref:hypothetical protein n=1 Tax=Microvirga sesbaniae TaxID=681392 RepID=UPI0021CA2B53|nr:hypothetical protein [Microvirga sp. HBU67692]